MILPAGTMYVIGSRHLYVDTSKELKITPCNHKAVWVDPEKRTKTCDYCKEVLT
jgi:hypothetical protein